MVDSYIQQLFTSRNNGTDSASFVGDQDRLWYDPVSNTLRVWNGQPGGQPVGSGGSASISVANSNVTLTNSVSSFNFVGSGVAVTAVGDAVTVDVPGAGFITFDGGSPFQDYSSGPAFDCGGVT
jgi:hypothetical protein